MAKNTLDDAIAGLKDLAKEVKRYCERLINNAKFDRTAVGTIVKVLDDHSGYVVAAFGKEYTIASNALFQVNDAVAVIAPQNDFKRLYIKPYEIDRNLLKQDKVEENLKDYVNKVDKLQEQVDGRVEQYFYNYDPTLENWPAMSWKDDITKKAHNGDLFYNTDSKKGWQWTYNDETKTGSWVEVTDKETLDTLEAASKAQDTGDGKRQVFTADASKGEHPEPPYDTGDLWFNGEDILVCTVARTASDKYNASDWVKKDSYASKDEVKDYVDDVTKDMQDQIDKKTEQYFYDYDPTLWNAPASAWMTDEDKAKHVDDLFFNTKTGKAYRFTKGESDYEWKLVQDEDVTKALEAASKAQDTADGKRQVFTADASKGEHPDPPYDVGDLWYTGAEVLVCKKAKAKGEAYDASDWEKKDNYTNDASVKDYVDGVTKDIQDQIDKKTEQYFYDYDPTLWNAPASAWMTKEDKAKHVDDLFYNTKTGKAYRFMEGDDDYKWELVQDEDITNALDAASKAQDTADGKRRVFTEDASKDEHPDPPYDEGDLWYTGAEVLVCGKPKAKGEVYDAGDWGKKDNYTNKDEVIDAVDKKLTQEDIFNRLTNNGASQGMFIDEATGDVYFNASYIATGMLASKKDNGGHNVYFDLDNGFISTGNMTFGHNELAIKTSRWNGGELARLYDTYYQDVGMQNATLDLTTYDNGKVSYRSSYSPDCLSFSRYDDDEETIKFKTAINTYSSTFAGDVAIEKELTTTTLKLDSTTNYVNVVGGALHLCYPTVRADGNIQLYKTGSDIPALYVYDGTTNWGGQTLGWDGSKEVTTLDANTQAVPFVYGIELVKNAQGYVTDVKLKQHGLRFIGGILV